MTLQDDSPGGSFPQASEDQWRKAVERALKGANSRQARLQDLRRRGDQSALSRAPEAPGPRSLRDNPGRWAILARVDIANSEAANAQALEDLEGGADGLHLVFAGSQGAYGAALNDDDDGAIAHVARQSASRLRHSRHGRGFAARAKRRRGDHALRRQANHIEPSITRVSFGFDPLGARLRHGFAAGAVERGRQKLRRSRQARRQGRLRQGNRRGGRPRRPCGGRDGGAGARLRARGRPRLSARAGRRWADIDVARKMLVFRLAADADEFARRRQVPRAARLVGARRGGLRPRSRAGAGPRRNRLAHDDRE